MNSKNEHPISRGWVPGILL